MRVVGARELRDGYWAEAEAATGADAFAAAGALADRIKYFALAYAGADGAPGAKGISLKKRDGLARLWFATHRSSAHAAALLADGRAAAFFQDLSTFEGLELRGRCVEETDPAAKAACWLSWYDQSFPRGQGDSAYLVFRFEAAAGNYCVGGRSLDFVP